MIVVRVGDVAVRVESPAMVERTLRARYGRFLSDGAGDLALRVTADDAFRDDFCLDDARAQLELVRDGDVLELAGARARGGFRLGGREGWLDGACHLGEVDALVRLALSLELPRRGALLVHGAAVLLGAGVAMLLGEPGAGKSTAAAALGALSDELTVIDVERVEAAGTPYWNGSPRRGPIVSLRILERGAPSCERLSGGAALRALAPHLVRYARVPEAEASILQLASRLCERLPVERLRCPEGAAYLPFLRRALGEGLAA
jgi:hypothetical protein